MKTYFKCEVSYLKEDESSGEEKQVSEQRLVNADSYTEAETAIHKHMEELLGQKTFTVKKIEKAKIHDTIDIDQGAEFWLAKTSFIVTTESGKDKKVVENVLVNAKHIKAAMEKLLVKFEQGTQAVTTRVVSLVETTIVEVHG